MPEHIPQWLVAAADQRLAEITAAGAKILVGLMQADTLFTTLTELPDGATEAERKAWEFTCDNCKKVFLGSKKTKFWSGAYTPGHNTTGKLTVIISWGACHECRFLP